MTDSSLLCRHILVLTNFWLLASVNLIIGCNGDILSNADFKLGIKNKRYDAIVDVRNQVEWDSGHIEGATFVENLASTGNADLLKGCENCTLAVYCRTGGRAGQAIKRLKSEFNFSGAELFNAGGVSQWTAAGNELVNTSSKPAACTNTDYVCTNKFTTPSSNSIVTKNSMLLSSISAVLIFSLFIL